MALLLPAALAATRRLVARRRGAPSDRVSAAGRTLVRDLRDLGVLGPATPLTSDVVPTVRDAVGVDLGPTVAELSRLRFAGRPVSEEDSRGVWRRVDEGLGMVRRGVPWWRRVAARLVPASSTTDLVRNRAGGRRRLATLRR